MSTLTDRIENWWDRRALTTLVGWLSRREERLDEELERRPLRTDEEP